MRIVIHCSASPHGRGDGAVDIHHWHRARGWAGIGYHYVITEHGELQNGRPEFWQGAHVEYHNRNSLGVCLIGMDNFTDKQYASLECLLRMLRTRYPEAVILGHYQLDHRKTCPNFDVPEWLERAGLVGSDAQSA